MDCIIRKNDFETIDRYGQLIRWLRRKAGLTLGDVARRLDKTASFASDLEHTTAMLDAHERPFKLFIVSDDIVVVAKDKQHAIDLVFHGQDNGHVKVKEIDTTRAAVVHQHGGV